MPDRPRSPSFLHRFSAYGDLTLKLQAWGARVCPSYLEPLFIAFYGSILFLVGHPVRRALMANFKVLFPEKSALTRFLDAYRVVWKFSFTLSDASRARLGELLVDWEVKGVADFEALGESNEGGILLTAHMGNYDVAASFFAEKFQRRLNTVRVPERHKETQEWKERELLKHTSDHYAVHYNKGDKMLGLELAQAIQRGEIVAIQGDRVMDGVSPMRVKADISGDGLSQQCFSIPKGPFVLAMTTGAPIYPVFIIRKSWRQYRIIVLPVIQCRAESRTDREAAIERAARVWVEEALLPLIREHWVQWFVFEEVFSPLPESA